MTEETDSRFLLFLREFPGHLWFFAAIGLALYVFVSPVSELADQTPMLLSALIILVSVTTAFITSGS